MKQDSLDSPVRHVLGGGTRHNLSVAFEEELNLFEQLVHVDGGEELRYLTGYLPQTLCGEPEYNCQLVMV